MHNNMFKDAASMRRQITCLSVMKLLPEEGKWIIETSRNLKWHIFWKT